MYYKIWVNITNVNQSLFFGRRIVNACDYFIHSWMFYFFVISISIYETDYLFQKFFLIYSDYSNHITSFLLPQISGLFPFISNNHDD